MELTPYFKSVLDQDSSAIVICNLSHEIIYMNPTAIERYHKRGGAALLGQNLLDCHNAHSNAIIRKVIAWFQESPEHNRIFTVHNEKENKDVYMVALREDDGTLIGYYEKHEYRNRETDNPYTFST
ncbi:MAG: PAS domain-containing protein [Eubacteriales bacterium]|nr:PAS domain-containing protein [Eubacteriales bacterium]